MRAPAAGVGVTGAEGAAEGPVPSAFVAATVKVYDVSVSPVIVHDVVAVLQVAPPGDAVTVYPVMADKP